MASVWWPLLIAVLAIGLAISMYREQRARGIKTNWSKTLTTGLATVVFTLVGIAALVGGMEGGYPLLGLSAFVIIFTGGLVAVTIYVRRRWPG